jgi:hypothetical protein
LSEALRASPGMCLVHLQQALRLARDGTARAWLLDIEAPKLQGLIDELGEFIRKHDYRFRGEPRGAERDAWLRAIEMVAGKRGIR